MVQKNSENRRTSVIIRTRTGFDEPEIGPRLGALPSPQSTPHARPPLFSLTPEFSISRVEIAGRDSLGTPGEQFSGLSVYTFIESEEPWFL